MFSAAPPAEHSRHRFRGDAVKNSLRVLVLGLCAASGAAAAQEAETAFLRGAEANRQGRFAEAEGQLLRAEALGHRDVELDFELGWAAMGRGQWARCIERLERFDRAAPGRGQASEFLGRCHLGQRQPEQAERRFREALQRDPRLAPTVNLSLASIEQSRGDAAGARARLEAVAAAEAPTGRALRELAGPADPVVQPDRPLRLSASLTTGYNDNVIGLGNTIPLPTDISRKGAWFVRLSGGGSYTHQVTARTSATAGYAVLLDRYDGISASNLDDHFVYGDLVHQASPRLGYSLRASAEASHLSSGHFRDVYALRPAVSYRFTGSSVTELSLTHSVSDYKTPVAPAFARDGNSQVLGAVHSFRLPARNWSGAAGITAGRNRTSGPDFNSASLGASGTLRYQFANRILASAGLGVSQDDYRDPNSLSGAPRKDRQYVASFQLGGPLRAGLRWYAQAQALRNDSNIAFYDYQQGSVSGGIAVDF
jgi:tetratricopeptide (TPR) repeat protein